MGKHKKNKPKKEKREISFHLTKEQRQEDFKEILKQLSKFEFLPRYEPVKEFIRNSNTI